MSKKAAVVDSPQASERRAWWFLDTLVVETGPSTHPEADAGPLPPGC
jgi:hypothetical protein